MAPTRLAFLAAETPSAQRALCELAHLFDHVPADQADVIVALGGDGFMLETLHAHIDLGVPIYGMNLGSVGFLLNTFRTENLLPRIDNATAVLLHPLRMRAICCDGQTFDGLGINEVSLFRETRQAANLKIEIDGVCRMPHLVCDGLLITSPAGSTAYNLSAHGPILPIGSNLLALTPISSFRPRRWRGAILPNNARFVISVLEAGKRPVSAVADFTEIRDVIKVEVWEDRTIELRLLFDPEHDLEERILNEQFLP